MNDRGGRPDSEHPAHLSTLSRRGDTRDGFLYREPAGMNLNTGSRFPQVQPAVNKNQMPGPTFSPPSIHLVLL